MMLNDVWTASKLSLKGEILPRLLVCEAAFLFTKSFMHMNSNRNTKEILRGVRWNGFSHVCVDCSLQTHSYPPQHSKSVMKSITFITQGASEALNKHTLLFSLHRGRVQVLQRIYFKLVEEWLKAQRNSLSLPNSSFLSSSYTNHKIAVPLLSVKEHWKWIRHNQRSELHKTPGKMAHKRQYTGSYFHGHGSLGLSREPKSPRSTVFKYVWFAKPAICPIFVAQSLFKN